MNKTTVFCVLCGKKMEIDVDENNIVEINPLCEGCMDKAEKIFSSPAPVLGFDDYETMDDFYASQMSEAERHAIDVMIDNEMMTNWAIPEHPEFDLSRASITDDFFRESEKMAVIYVLSGIFVIIVMLLIILFIAIL